MEKKKELIKIIIEPGMGEYIEKKSRFIANIKSVNNEDEAIAFINEMKKKYWDARHNCMAYVLGEKKNIVRFSDDGEPLGTAGKPILDVILGSNVINVVIVVTRYFGGVLLGTGGLVRSYQKAAMSALENSVMAEKAIGVKCRLTTDYNGLGKIQYIAAQENVELVNLVYTDRVEIDMVCKIGEFDHFKNKIIEATAAKTKFSEKETVSFYKGEQGVILL